MTHFGIMRNASSVHGVFATGKATPRIRPLNTGCSGGMIKHIEYDSNAEIATDTAVNGAATIGFGYFRIMPEYEHEKSFDQVLRFTAVL